MAELTREKESQALRQSDPGRARESIAKPVNKTPQLLPNAAKNEAVGVARTRNPEATREINKSVAVGVPNVAAEGPIPNDRVLTHAAGLGTPISPSGDGRALMCSKSVNPRHPTRPRQGRIKLRKRCAVLGPGRGLKTWEVDVHSRT